MIRKMQELLIRDNRADIAQDLTIAFICENWGTRYDQEIRELLEYSFMEGARPNYVECSFLFDKKMAAIKSQPLKLKYFK